MYRRDLRETDRDRLPADMAIAEEIVQVVPEPGGERLAYACAREDRLDLWLATNGEDRRLTSEGIAALRYGRTDSRWFGWAPDGESLAYASAEGELWRVGTESGEKHRLTRHEATEAEPRWSPDGDRLACVTDYWSPTGLAALEADGSGLACLRADEYHYSDPRWADRETLYAVRSRHRDLFDYEAEIARIDVTGDCEVLFAESGVRAYAPRPRPESEGVAFVHDASGFDALYLADPQLSEQASGEGSNDGIEQLYATDGTEVGAPAWDSSGERLAVTTTREGSVGIDVVGRDGESRELPTDPGRRHAPAWHDGAVVCVESTPRRPAWVVERGADAATDADTSANADVEAAGTGRTLAGTVPVGFEERLREPEARTYEAPDGREVHAMAYLPDGIDERADESLLLLVHSHGGPTAFDGFAYDFRAQYFASLGYAVIEPNYRGSDGFGRAVRDANDRARGAGDLEEVIDAADALAGWYEAVDGDRAGIFGGSGGGLMTANALRRSDRFLAGAAFYGVYGYETFVDDTDDVG